MHCWVGLGLIAYDLVNIGCTMKKQAPAPELVSLVLVLVLILIRFVMPDYAACRRADCSMMPGDMSGHPADSRALGTALGVGWQRRYRDNKRQGAG